MAVVAGLFHMNKLQFLKVTNAHPAVLECGTTILVLVISGQHFRNDNGQLLTCGVSRVFLLVMRVKFEHEKQYQK